MTGTARHNERVRLTALSSTDLSSFEKQNTTRLPTNITWLVAVCACLTALVVKLSQQYLYWADENGVVSDLGVAFDWVAILTLHPGALALIAVQTMPTGQKGDGTEIETTVSPDSQSRTFKPCIANGRRQQAASCPEPQP